MPNIIWAGQNAECFPAILISVSERNMKKRGKAQSTNDREKLSTWRFLEAPLKLLPIMPSQKLPHQATLWELKARRVNFCSTYDDYARLISRFILSTTAYNTNTAYCISQTKLLLWNTKTFFCCKLNTLEAISLLKIAQAYIRLGVDSVWGGTPT